VDVASGAVERVTTGDEENSPAVARDGRVLYSTGSHQTDLYIQNLATGEARRLTRHTKDNFGAALSPDGKSVAYMSDRTGDTEIWLLELETDKERRLTQREGRDWGPDWMPDGEEIVFSSRSGGERGIWSVSPEGGVPRLIGHYPDAISSPHVSPDGAAIGFLQRSGSESDMYAIDPDGGEPRLLCEGVDQFRWYLDSNRIVYRPSDPDRTQELRVRDLETGEDELLTSATYVELEVARDGSILSFVSSMSHFNMNLHVLRLNPPTSPGGLPTPAGEVEVATHGEGEWHVHNGGFSTDGSRVVYTRDTDSGDIYLLEGVFGGK
jgi:dipeptidyl aminopeptidase/acylaminoacyl peptidase